MMTLGFMYRRNLALRLLKKIKIDSALEIGFANRDLLSSIKARHKVGIDLKKAKRKFKTIQIDEKDFKTKNKVDLVIALEVLEHIKDDEKALKRWSSWLKEGGYLLLSVPANIKHWDLMDDYAGHKRRYGRREILSKAYNAGLKNVQIYHYGFPILNFSKWFKNKMMKKQRVKSNVGHLKGFKVLIAKSLLLFIISINELFLWTNLGIGYIVLLRRFD